MVCAVQEIEKSTLFLGEGGKCDQDAQKFNFITKCLNTFVAHCSFVIEDYLKVLKLFPVVCRYRWHGWKWIETRFKKSKNCSKNPQEIIMVSPL